MDPPYFAAIAGVLFLGYVSTFVPSWKGSFDVSLVMVLGHFAYLNAFIGFALLVPVFWTLAIEFQFYLLIALLFPLIIHRNDYCRVLTLAAVCCLSSLFVPNDATSF